MYYAAPTEPLGRGNERGCGVSSRCTPKQRQLINSWFKSKRCRSPTVADTELLFSLLCRMPDFNLSPRLSNLYQSSQLVTPHHVIPRSSRCLSKDSFLKILRKLSYFLLVDDGLEDQKKPSIRTSQYSFPFPDPLEPTSQGDFSGVQLCQSQSFLTAFHTHCSNAFPKKLDESIRNHRQHSSSK